MAKQTWVNVGGTWRKVKSAWNNVDGVWKKDVMPKGVASGGYKEFMQYIRTQLQLIKTFSGQYNSVGYYSSEGYYYKADPQYAKYIYKYDNNFNLLQSKSLTGYDSSYIRRTLYLTSENSVATVLLGSFYTNLSNMVVKLNASTLSQISTLYVTTGQERTEFDTEAQSMCQYVRDGGYSSLGVLDYKNNIAKRYILGQYSTTTFPRGFVYFNNSLYIVSPTSNSLVKYKYTNNNEYMYESSGYTDFIVTGYSSIRKLFIVGTNMYCIDTSRRIYSVNTNTGVKTLLVTVAVTTSIDDITSTWKVGKDYIYFLDKATGIVYKLDKENFNLIASMSISKTGRLVDMFIDRTIDEGQIIIKQYGSDSADVDHPNVNSHIYNQI